MNKFFQTEIDASQTIHFETDKMKDAAENFDPENFNDFTVYESNASMKRKIGKPQLTTARIVCAQHGKKVFFGQPDPLILIEDICARNSIEELESAFYNSCQLYHDS